MWLSKFPLNEGPKEKLLSDNSFRNWLELILHMLRTEWINGLNSFKKHKLRHNFKFELSHIPLYELEWHKTHINNIKLKVQSIGKNHLMCKCYWKKISLEWNKINAV